MLKNEKNTGTLMCNCELCVVRGDITQFFPRTLSYSLHLIHYYQQFYYFDLQKVRRGCRVQGAKGLRGCLKGCKKNYALCAPLRLFEEFLNTPLPTCQTKLITDLLRQEVKLSYLAISKYLFPSDIEQEIDKQRFYDTQNWF